MQNLKSVFSGNIHPDKLQGLPENHPKSMFEDIKNLLNAFRSAFPAPDHFHFFLSWIIGLILANDDVGTESALMRGLKWSSRNLYDRLSRFIHSPKWMINKLKEIWLKVAVRLFPLEKSRDGSHILIADHSNLSKDGVKMSGLTKIKSSSKSKSKKEQSNGIVFGMIAGLLKVGGKDNEERYLAAPLYGRRHSGFSAFSCFRKSKDKQVQNRIKQIEDDEGLSIVQKMARDLVKVVSIMNLKKAVVLLDRGFFSEKLLKIIAEFNEQGKAFINVVVRCRVNTVAYKDLTEEQKNPSHKSGRRRKNGDKVKLKDLFLKPDLFHTATAKIYGKMETIKYYCTDLNWHGFKLRFVLVDFYDSVKNKHRQMILASNQLLMDPVEMAELYCLRFRIEQSFRDLKVFLHLNSGRFNSHKAPRFSRVLEKLQRLYGKITNPSDQVKILDSVLAMEASLFFSMVALGVVYYLCERYQDRPEILDEDFSCVSQKSRRATVTTIQQTMRKHYLDYVYNGPKNSFFRKFLYSYVTFKKSKSTKVKEIEVSGVNYVQETLF